MAKFVYTNAYVSVGGTDLSAWVESVSSDFNLEEQDSTAMNSAAAKSSLAGLYDGTVEIGFIQDFAASAVDATLYTAWAAKADITVEIRPVNTSRSATNPGFSGSYKLFNYSPMAGAQVGQTAKTNARLRSQGALSKLTS